MELRDLNEIKSAIKYMDFKPVTLAKFYDIKSLLLKEIVANEEAYKVASIMPNPGNDNKIIKCVNVLVKKYTGGKEEIDLTRTPGAMPEAAVELFKSVKTTEGDTSVYITFDKCIKGDMYMNIPRGNSMTIANQTFGSDVALEVMNIYNTYYTEGFTLALHMDGLAVAIEPSSLDGIKGQGEVFVYAMTDTAVYKDLASKYFDTSAILKYYRG